MRRKRAMVNDALVQEVAARFAVLSEPQRLKILRVLEEGEHSVNALVKATHGTQSNISRHLKALLDNGLVQRRRDGNTIYYSIADPMIFQLCDLVCGNVVKEMEKKLGQLVSRR